KGGKMSFLNTSSVALQALLRNPTRALLTTLGIVIGIAAVIAMMEIGNGSARSIRENIEKMGANSITVMAGARRVAGISMGTSSWISLLPADAEAIRHECPSVQYVSSLVGASNIQLIYGNNNWVPANITGVDVDYFKIRNWDVAEGRLFTRREVDSNARVCLVGQTVLKELFNGESPLNVELRIGNATFRVIGILQAKGSNMWGSDEDDVILAPWTTVRMRITGRRNGAAANTSSTASSTPGAIYSGSGIALYPEQSSSLSSDRLWSPKFTFITQILVSAVSTEKVPDAVREISLLLRERHKLSDEIDDDFRVHNSADFLNMLNGTSALMTNLLLIVAMISLIVGGVGIMNIMLVSVTERTREIGLRMAVGARSRDILKQFLVESIVLCVFGGIIGIIVGHGTALLVESQLRWPIAASPSAVIASFAVSAAVGVLFGFYHAWKASKLGPIEALHYE
ncbi:MAG: ABC transporter permease, partial [Victivallaceae bacterium]|nr:ABC transporter permease [Victivallaceae bacterium]